MKRYFVLLLFVLVCLVSLIGQPVYAGKAKPKICKQLPNGKVQEHNCVTVTPTSTNTSIPTRTPRPTNTVPATVFYPSKTPQPATATATVWVKMSATPSFTPTATSTAKPTNTPNPAYSPTPTLWCEPGCIFLPSY